MLINMDKSLLIVMMEAGYVYLGMQRIDEAMGVFKGVSALAPDSDAPLVAMGNVEFCKGKFDKAIACYKKALKKVPNSLFAKAYTAEALFFSNKVDKAKKLLVEVKSADPEGGAGGFAIALLQAIEGGFTPKKLVGLEKMESKNGKKI